MELFEFVSGGGGEVEEVEGGEGGAMAHLPAVIFFHGVVAWRGLSTPQ